MDGKTVFFALALATSPACAGIAVAAERLSEGQMDRVTAGALAIECLSCGNVSISTISMSVNGVTTTTSSSTGGSNSSSGNSGSSGNSSSGGGSTGPGGPSVVTTITVPGYLAAIINTALAN